MSSHRYHAHIICVAHNQPQVLDSLAMFFQSYAFLTYDVATELPQAFLYARQCIEACDYAVVVVGDSYGMGSAQNMGVSQMHLSYLSARAKLKPILILIKQHDETFESSRQLQEFTKLLKQQEKHVYYYDDTTDIKQLLSKAYQELVANFELAASWVKFDKHTTDYSSPNPTFRYTEPSTITTSTPASNKSLSNKPPMTERFNSQNQNLNQDFGTMRRNDHSPVFHTLELSEKLTISYSAQAYEGGNLTDITMAVELTWQEVLQALIKIPATFSNYGLQSCMNRLIAVKAEQDIKQKMPNVHAVARYQIIQNDLYKLQRLMIAAHWIQLATSGAKTSQQLWKVTPYAKKLFKTGQL